MKLLITNFFSLMVKNFDLISIIVATCLTWISRFDFSRSVTVIIRDQLTPESFFPPNSFINDYPNGSLSIALDKFKNHNIVLIYSYSHWDAESVLHKNDIEKVAEATQYMIPIISINCWDNNSNCYDILRPHRFPQLYAYVSDSFFVEYKRSMEPIEIFNFISSLFYPFHFSKSVYDLDNLIKSSDVSFIICLNSKTNDFYNRIRIFHKISSIYKGENLHRPNIAFIVLSESDAMFTTFIRSLNLTINEAILYSPTRIEKKFPGKYCVKEVLEFLRMNSFRATINKYSPNGVKSLNLQNLLKTGVVIFYVFDELQTFSWDNIRSRFYFEELAMRTVACSNNSKNASVPELSNLLKERMITRYLNQHKDNLSCQMYFQSSIYSNFSFDIVKYLKHLDLNRSDIPYYLPDPFVTHSTILDVNWSCRKQLLMKQYKIDDVAELSQNIRFLLTNSTEHENSPACTANFNRSITFAEMNGNKFMSFLNKWGLPATEIVQPQIVVVDWQNEMIHQMQSDISQISLNRLVHQIVTNNLTSHLKSNEYVFRDFFHPNIYPIDSVKLEQELQDPDTDLIVFYYTPWCSYCSTMMHLLVMLVRYFRNYPKLHFTSFDTFNNDLPYKYQSDRIPALIMFPRGRKSDSFIFKMTDKSVSLSGLVRFVLENSGDENLNLNSPSSVSYNSEYNVTCNRLCLESAQASIAHLLKILKHAFKSHRQRLRVVRARIQEYCLSDEFHWLFLQVAQATDWSEVQIKQYYIRHQAQLIREYGSLSRNERMLLEKIEKLTKLNRAIIHMREKKLSNRSVQSLAIDILNFSA